MKTFAVILASGEGRRFSKDHKKQFQKIGTLPIWVKATLPFQESEVVDRILVVVPRENVDAIKSEISTYSLTKVVNVISGGQRRQDSVYEALQWLRNYEDMVTQYLFIHDGVRPFLTKDLIEKLWEEKEFGAVIPALPMMETIKSIEDGFVTKTLDRSTLQRIQTPQLFQFEILWKGYQWLVKNPREITDDATLLECIGQRVKVVEGELRNIKITTSKDLEILKESISVGQGVDIHAFGEGSMTQGTKIILGGIEIPHEKYLRGHSDADVLTHSICDALLGAAGFSDIGTYFPDNDPQYRGISSLILLERVVEMLRSKGYSVHHMDATVMAEIPKLLPYIPEMKIRLSRILGITVDQIAIKATTSERLGFIGREEGIASITLATVNKITWK